jgi:hypothetical protein
MYQYYNEWIKLTEEEQNKIKNRKTTQNISNA